MATPTQFAISHKELASLIVKHQGIHEGRWLLSFGFGFAPGNFGPNDAQISPGIVIAVNQIFIQREPEGGPPFPEALVVDAAVENPAPKKK